MPRSVMELEWIMNILRAHGKPEQGPTIAKLSASIACQGHRLFHFRCKVTLSNARPTIGLSQLMAGLADSAPPSVKIGDGPDRLETASGETQEQLVSYAEL